jgi:hypothetical protein
MIDSSASHLVVDSLVERSMMGIVIEHRNSVNENQRLAMKYCSMVRRTMPRRSTPRAESSGIHICQQYFLDIQRNLLIQYSIVHFTRMAVVRQLREHAVGHRANCGQRLAAHTRCSGER